MQRLSAVASALRRPVLAAGRVGAPRVSLARARAVVAAANGSASAAARSALNASAAVAVRRFATASAVRAADAPAAAAGAGESANTHTIIGTDERVTVDPTPYALPAAFTERAGASASGFNVLKYVFKLKSHDKPFLDEAVTKLRVFFQYILQDVTVSNPAHLPRETFRFTVLRSPAQDKSHRYQYEMRTHTSTFSITLPHTPEVRHWLEYDVLRHYWFQLHAVDVHVRRQEIRNYFQRNDFQQFLVDQSQRKRSAAKAAAAKAAGTPAKAAAPPADAKVDGLLRTGKQVLTKATASA